MNFLFVLIIFSTVSCGFLLRRRGGGVRVGEGIGERGAGGGGEAVGSGRESKLRVLPYLPS